MKRIKTVNGYAIYQAITQRDADNYSCQIGSYNLYLSSDIRDYGLANSYPEYDDIDSLAVALELANGSNYAIACALAEELSDSTIQDMDLVIEIERRLDEGQTVELITESYDTDEQRFVETGSVLTYEEFIAMAKQNYNKGGDGYVECWEEYQFDYYVKEFGPITEKKALKMFALDYEQEREHEEFIRWASGVDYRNEETEVESETIEKPAGDWRVAYISESGETVDVETGVTKEWAEEFCSSNWGMWPDKDAPSDDYTGLHLRDLIVLQMENR